jgi:NAD(P)-dependent dehydrogenase (short-subunit alcohol dehydrogenase family)
MEKKGRIVLVTGASSGIGNACAAFLAKKGYKVYGTCRNPGAYARKDDELFEMLPLDLTQDASIARAAKTLLEKEGTVDAIVACAAMGIAGSIEETPVEEVSRQMDTNFTGTVRVVKAFLPAMREAGKGRILILGSLAGLAGVPFQSFYSASKFALEGFVECLRHEMRPFGVQACIIEPGDFRTGFTAARTIVPASLSSPYKAFFESAIGVQERDEQAGKDPLIVARLVLRLLESPRLPVRVGTGGLSQRIGVALKRWVPAKVFESGIQALYKLR